MSRRLIQRSVCVALSAVVLIAFTGCMGGGTGLPETVDLVLPDGTTVSVTQGSGAAFLADTVWEFRSEAGVAFVTIRFGPAGELTRFDNNTIAQDILGTTLLFDGERHATGVPPVEYAAATFGAETVDATGFSFEGQLSAFVPILGKIGAGEASAIGELDPEDSNIMTGTFTYSFEVTAALPIEIPFNEDDMSGEFEFIAERIE